jgi:glucan 1,3-beta-glucosidase
MKKIVLLVTIALSSLLLIGCETTTTVTIPNFVGEAYGEVITWSKEYDVEISVTSQYNDDVLPQTVLTQSHPEGTVIDSDDFELAIVYSRGYDPDGEITLPDFTGFDEDDIKAWLIEQDISKYYFYNTFDPDIEEGLFVGIDVSSFQDSEHPLRRDTFSFFLSIGPLDVEEVEFDEAGTVRGVNLGGWFVLEGWMSPDLFEGVSGSDETIFMEEKPNAAQALEEHWQTFITEDDFEWLSDHGVNYVRLPIPWWLYGEEFTYTHEGITHNITYARSFEYIQQAMEWAEEYNINVLLDLHTAPGGQNGFDNGGISDVLQWPREENVDRTLVVMEQIAKDFKDYDSLWGIQVLNEPGWGVDMGILQQYYIDSYNLIREHAGNDVWVVFHDGFRGYLTQTWNDFFRSEENNFSNVIFDIHLYQVFGDQWGEMNIMEHIDYVHVQQRQSIFQLYYDIPVIIGEWSIGLPGSVFEDLNQDGVNTVRTAFANAQLNVYEEAFGWFFWSYKIDRNSHTEWDFRRLVDLGIFPDNFETQTED